MRAIVRSLEERALLDPRPGRTADEAAAEAGRTAPRPHGPTARRGPGLRRRDVRRPHGRRGDVPPPRRTRPRPGAHQAASSRAAPTARPTAPDQGAADDHRAPHPRRPRPPRRPPRPLPPPARCGPARAVSLLALVVLLAAAVAIAAVRSGRPARQPRPALRRPAPAAAPSPNSSPTRASPPAWSPPWTRPRAAAGPDTTLLVAGPDLLTDRQQNRLHSASAALRRPHRPRRPRHRRPSTPSPPASTPTPRPASTPTLSPDCALPAARRAGTADTGGIRYTTSAPDADSCYPSDGLPTLLRVPATDGNGDTVVLGAPDILHNERLDEQGNASLALQLLGSRPHLVWYLPSLSDDSATDAGRRAASST